MSVKVYSEYGDFQIRDICYLGPKRKKKEPVTEFDVVKFYDHEPIECIDARTGKKIISTRSCYSIGFLKWDEDDFEFESVGLRYLEETNFRVNHWLLKFAKEKEEEFRNGEDY